MLAEQCLPVQETAMTSLEGNLGNGTAIDEDPLDEEIITGMPVVDEDGTMIVDGQKIKLWGVTLLDSDQQCWQNNVSWCCGEQAVIALRHFIDGRMVECIVIERHANEPITAQCFRNKGTHKRDIARHMIRHGWATSDDENKDTHYTQSQRDAFTEKRGIWSSRFQSPSDWREGIQRFLNDEPK